MNDTTSDGPSSSTSRHENSSLVISQCRRSTDISAGPNATTTNQETSEESEYEERLLVVNYRSAKLGAAYYTLQTGELFVSEEIVDRGPEYTMFCSLFRQVEPIRLVVDGSQPAAFLRAVKANVLADDGGGQRHQPKCKMVSVSARDYNYEACKRRIYSLSLPSEPSHCSDRERCTFLRTVLDFTQGRTMHALGALLRYLDLNWGDLARDSDVHAKPQFLTLRRVSLADIVTMDRATYLGLQVFSPTAHPSAFRRGDSSAHAEGDSLLRLFTRCVSPHGRRAIRVLMQHPSRDLELLRRRQEVIAHCVLPSSEPFVRNVTASLRHMRNVSNPRFSDRNFRSTGTFDETHRMLQGILAKIRALSAKPGQWKSLYNTLYNAVLICELCEPWGSVALLRELATFDTSQLHQVALHMHRIVDFDRCTSEGKFSVRPGVDVDLDTKKQTMASLHGLMSETAKVELDRLPPYIEECSMVYLPHLGYLLGVKAWEPDLTTEQKELPDMRFMFQNDDYIHYKSKGCEELDLLIGDTYPSIVSLETRIMMRLTALISEHLHSLHTLVDMCAHLDCLIAMSRVALEFNYVRPSLTSSKEIAILGGRHPLHLLAGDSFVPNDYHSGAAAGLAKVITGPNASGKSVYIKQIGLIVYLAHIGSFVPASGASVGLVSAIQSRLHCAESVAEHMSAFLIDLRQMALALQQCDSRSLLLVDEFGKGSCPSDGLALLAAAVDSLLCRRLQCPHLLVATHYLNIHHLLLDTPILRFMRFEHVIQAGSPVFLFRAVDGASDCSLAHRVASSCGIRGDVIERADTVLASLMNNSLPPVDKKIASKLKSCTEIITDELLSEDI